MFPSKRRHNEIDYDDDDEEEPSFGRQILPVAALPDDFEGEPMDGMQYLFTVRREGRTLPHVTRVNNPYAKPEIPIASPRRTVSHPYIPSQEWRTAYEDRFRCFRKNLNQPIIHVEMPSTNSLRRLMPDKSERDLWWAFLSGKPETEWNPPKKPKKQNKRRKGMHGYDYDYDTESTENKQEVWYINEDGDVSLKAAGGRAPSPTPGSPSPSITAEPTVGAIDELRPREPTTQLLKQIDERMAFHLLMYFTHWMNLSLQELPTSKHQMTESHARWMFALLTRIDDYVPADDMCLLRNFARACLETLKLVLQRRLVGGETSASNTTTTALVSHPPMSESACWILISTVVGVWAQRDLWMDTEDAVAGILTSSLKQDEPPPSSLSHLT